MLLVVVGRIVMLVCFFLGMLLGDILIMKLRYKNIVNRNIKKLIYY